MAKAVNTRGAANSIRHGVTAPREVALAAILSVILDVRRAGFSFAEMGRELVARAPDHMAALGYHGGKAPAHTVCHRWTRRAFEEARAHFREQSDDVRRQVEERLDAITHANWKAMQAGDVAAGRLVLAAEDRRAKLLGLDKREDKTDLADAIAELVRARVGTDGRLTSALPSPDPTDDVVDVAWTDDRQAQTSSAGTQDGHACAGVGADEQG